MREMVYEGNIVPMLESTHVFDECDSVAKEITKQIKESLNRFTTLLSVRLYVETMDFIYTGFNFNPDYLTQSANLELSVTAFEKLDDESKPHPIYYTLYYEPTSTELAATTHRKIIIKDSVRCDENDGKIQIEINLARFLSPDKDMNYLSMMSNIAHELQHVFDMYILPDRNFADGRSQGLYYDFLESPIVPEPKSGIPVSRNIKKIVDSILYCLTPSEQRGFLSQLRTLLNGISKDDKLKQRLFISHLHNSRNSKGYPTTDYKTDFDESTLIASVMNNPVIRNISRLSTYETAMSFYDDLEIPQQNYIMLVAGYYLNRHGMLNLKNGFISCRQANNFFGSDNLSIYMDNENSILKKPVEEKWIGLVTSSIDSLYRKYYRLVEREINRHLHGLFNYDVIDEAKLKDYYGNSITETFLWTLKSHMPINLYD